jgi:hypothetical protein
MLICNHVPIGDNGMTKTKKNDGEPDVLMFFTHQPLWRLANKLKLSPQSIFFVYAAISFGGLTLLHAIIDKNPLPSSRELIFQLPPPGTYYYPNLFGLVFDLLAGPFTFFLSIWAPVHISEQIQLLISEGFLKPKGNLSKTGRLITNSQISLWASQIIALLVVLGILISGITTIIHDYLPGSAYAITLSTILSATQDYARVIIVFDFVYLTIFLNQHRITPKLRFFHPDGCGGLRPFGEFAKIAYYFLFAQAMMLAIMVASSDSFAFLRRIGPQISTILQYLFVLVFFPLITVWLFYYFLYLPHYKMEQLKEEHLNRISKTITKRAEGIIDIKNNHANLKQSQDTVLEEGEQTSNSPDKDLIETYNRIRDIPSWPITASFLKRSLVLTNPFLPTFITFLRSILDKLLS